MQSVFFKDPGRRKLQLEFDKHRNDNFKVLDDLGDTCDSLPFNFMPNYRLQIYTDDVTQTNCIPFEHPPAMMEAFVSGINTFSCEQIKRKKGAWTRTSGLGASSSRMASQS